MEIAVAGLLALWLALSLIAQIPSRIAERIRGWDACGLIPSWSFFAPHPARTDPHLLYRHRCADGAVSAWTEAFVWRPARCRCLFNPDRRAEKAIADASSYLQSRQQALGVRLSVAYLLLLDYVGHLPGPPDAVAVQFALLGSWGPGAPGEPFVRFVSDTHPLAAGRAAGGAAAATGESHALHAA